MEVSEGLLRKLVSRPVLTTFPSFDHLCSIRSERYKEASLRQDSYSESVCCCHSTWRKTIKQVAQGGNCVSCDSDCSEAWNQNGRSLQ